jgi:hypothetical protein
MLQKIKKKKQNQTVLLTFQLKFFLKIQQQRRRKRNGLYYLDVHINWLQYTNLFLKKNTDLNKIN